MNRLFLPLGLATATGVVALGGALLRTPVGMVPARAPAQSTANHSAIPPDSLALRSWVAQAPFRRDRRLSNVEYDVRRALAAALPPAAPRPQLLLRGLVGGVEPAAIVEGLPGVEGPRVVRAGERVGELMVRRIANSRVVISGMDTTWALELPRRDP